MPLPPPSTSPRRALAGARPSRSTRRRRRARHALVVHRGPCLSLRTRTAPRAARSCRRRPRRRRRPRSPRSCRVMTAVDVMLKNTSAMTCGSMSDAKVAGGLALGEVLRRVRSRLPPGPLAQELRDLGDRLHVEREAHRRRRRSVTALLDLHPSERLDRAPRVVRLGELLHGEARHGPLPALAERLEDAQLVAEAAEERDLVHAGQLGDGARRRGRVAALSRRARDAASRIASPHPCLARRHRPPLDVCKCLLAYWTPPRVCQHPIARPIGDGAEAEGGPR